MNRKGDLNIVVKIVLWLAVIALMLFITIKYISGGGSGILGPLDGLFGGS